MKDPPHAQFCVVAMQSTAAKAKAKAEKEDSKDGAPLRVKRELRAE